MSYVCPCKLNTFLANLAVWNIKLHNYHWNVKGPFFVPLHNYTEELYNRVFGNFDEVAEILKMRGEQPLSTMKEYLAKATIQEAETRTYSCHEVSMMIYADMEFMLQLAEEIRNDAAEADDFQVQGAFEGYISAIKKDLWFLRSMREDCCGEEGCGCNA